VSRKIYGSQDERVAKAKCKKCRNSGEYLVGGDGMPLSCAGWYEICDCAKGKRLAKERSEMFKD